MIIKYGILSNIQNATKKRPDIICETNNECSYKYSCNGYMDLTNSDDFNKGIMRIAAPPKGRCYYQIEKEGDKDG